MILFCSLGGFGWDFISYLGAGVGKELLKVGDAKVGDTNVPDLAGADELLQLGPGVPEVPVGVVLLQVLRGGGAGPVHEVQVDVVGAEVLETLGDALLDTLVPRVVELGGEPDLVTGNTRGLDALTNLLLVAIGERSVDVAVAGAESGLDGVAHLVGLGLPGAQANSGDLVARVEGEGTAARKSVSIKRERLMRSAAQAYLVWLGAAIVKSRVWYEDWRNSDIAQQNEEREGEKRKKGDQLGTEQANKFINEREF